jgi:hypothetical protein
LNIFKYLVNNYNNEINNSGKEIKHRDVSNSTSPNIVSN